MNETAAEHLQARFRISGDPERSDALEDALLDAGAVAITLDSPDGDPVLEPAPGEHPLWDDLRVTVLFPSDVDAERVRSACRAILDEEPQEWQVEALGDQAWERAWLDDFQPAPFGRRLWVVPGHREDVIPELPADAVVLRLDPGLAFGTGTHETTALCMEWLDHQDLSGVDVIDYGCGSGILAVAAALLGARRVVAIDHDPQALDATRENAERNGVAHQIEVYGADYQPEPADCVVANILAGTLQQIAPELTRICRTDGGRIALSGILDGQEWGVMDAFTGAVEWNEPVLQGDWVRLDGRRRQG